MWCAYKTHWTISHHESPTPKRGTWTTLTRHSWLKSCQNIKHISQYKMHIDLGYPLLTKYIYRNAYAFLDFTMPHLLGNYFGWKTSVNWHVINLTSDGRRNLPRNRRYHAPLWRQVVGYLWERHMSHPEGRTCSKVEVAYDLVLNTEIFQNRQPDYYFVWIQLAKALNLDFWSHIWWKL